MRKATPAQQEKTRRRSRKANGLYDEIDSKIIMLLREDGRRTIADLSKEVNISETATRVRVSKLIKDELLQIVAITNPVKLGLTVDVFITLQTDPAVTMQVVDALNNLDEVRYVAVLSGRYDVVFSSAFQSDAELLEFLTEKVGRIPGVVRMETFRILKTTKRTYDRVWPVQPKKSPSL